LATLRGSPMICPVASLLRRIGHAESSKENHKILYSYCALILHDEYHWKKKHMSGYDDYNGHGIDG
jgi:hypothetical protein